MALESLNNQINIHDLTLEQEKKPMPEWQMQYEKLKDSSLYEPETGFWNIAMQDSGNVTTRKSASSQLIGVVSESFLNKAKAIGIYKHLKETNFYNTDTNRWNSSINPDGKVDGKDNDNVHQLFALLSELYIDPNLAKAHFDEFKSSDSEYFDHEKSYWMPTRDFHETDMKVEEHIHTAVELLSIIFESSFNIESARNHWEKMLSSPVFIKKNDQIWASGMNNGKGYRPSGNQTEYQLLGILAEAKFDRQSAKARFEAMKNSEYYDKDSGFWNDRDLETFSRSRNPVQYYSTDQLLAILCQHEFESSNINLKPSNSLPPEIRNY